MEHQTYLNIRITTRQIEQIPAILLFTVEDRVNDHDAA